MNLPTIPIACPAKLSVPSLECTADYTLAAWKESVENGGGTFCGRREAASPAGRSRNATTLAGAPNSDTADRPRMALYHTLNGQNLAQNVQADRLALNSIYIRRS